MRNIKFRAWDKEWKVMQYTDESLVLCISDEGIDVTDHSHFTSSCVGMQEYELMQFTGLYDKNGKEIYEGDIVRLKNSLDLIDYNALIIFKDGGFCAIDGTEDNYAVSRYRLSDFDLKITVLGNIYENPELLKETEQ